MSAPRSPITLSVGWNFRPAALVAVLLLLSLLALTAAFFWRFTSASPPALAAGSLPATPTPTATAPVPTASPSPQPTPLSILTPTPLPVWVAWNPAGREVYTWREPGYRMLAALPNGERVYPTWRETDAGGHSWLEIELPAGPAWVSARLLWRLPGEPVAYLAAERGAYLRREPAGQIVGLAPYGTPLVALLEERSLAGRPWSLVCLPDGSEGWLLSSLLDVLR